MSTVDVEITLKPDGRRKPRQETEAAQAAAAPHIHRITRLMALAIKFQDMVDRGKVRDYADLARLGYVMRARITQIMNLLHLSPDIQEQLLWSSPDHLARKPAVEGHIRRVAAAVDWAEQRRQRNGEDRG